MRYDPKFSIRQWIARLVPLAAVVAIVSMASAAPAQDVIKVEEDWELALGNPDQLVCGPQIVTTMSPFANINDAYFTLEINHRSAPYWTPGGISMHLWSGAWRISSYDRADRTVMDTDNEVVTWTQQLYVENGNRLVFEVVDGHSTTWGSFGFSGMFKVNTNWGVNNINSYTPGLSIAESGVPYAGNRVHSLKIKEVRLHLSDGTVLTDSTERVAHQLIE